MILFLVGQSTRCDYNLEYLSSNENLEKIYRQVHDVRGRGLLVCGGFDQAVSLVANTHLKEIILIDINYKALKSVRT